MLSSHEIISPPVMLSFRFITIQNLLVNRSCYGHVFAFKRKKFKPLDKILVKLIKETTIARLASSNESESIEGKSKPVLTEKRSFGYLLITWDYAFFFPLLQMMNFTHVSDAIWWSVTKRKSVTYQLIPKVSKTSAVDAAVEYISSFALPTASLRSRREWVPTRSSVPNARTRVEKRRRSREECKKFRARTHSRHLRRLASNRV